MLLVDDKSKDLICIQIPNIYRRELVFMLESAMKKNESLNLPCKNYEIRINFNASEFQVLIQGRNIEINFRNEDAMEFVAAIGEHIKERSDMPLDHSLEALGAKFTPSQIEDVVFETIA